MRVLIPVLMALMLALPVRAEPVVFPAREATKETLVIYSSTDIDRMVALIAGFQANWPAIRVDYHELDTIDIYRRAVAEMDANLPGADLLLSSAMDLQIKLVNDGYATAHRSAETEALPGWANWRDEAFGITFEPAVMIYNRSLAPDLAGVTTRFELARRLAADAATLRHRVVTYDPERSGLGFLFATHDVIQSEDFWYLARSLGDLGVGLESGSAAMIDKVASGDALIAYNVLGSYATARARDNPDLAITLPQDYCLVMSRIAVVARGARNSQGAGRFIDFLLSRQGQELIAGPASLYSLRADIEGEFTAARLRREARGPLIPIRLGPGLLVYLDRLKRRDFLDRWHRALARE